MSTPSNVSAVSLVTTAIEKKNNDNSPDSAPMPTAETNSSAQRMSGKARMTLPTARTTKRTMRFGAPNRVDHNAKGRATTTPADVPRMARRSVSRNAARVRAENIWSQSVFGIAEVTGLSLPNCSTTARSENPVPYSQSHSVSSVRTMTTTPTPMPNRLGPGLRRPL